MNQKLPVTSPSFYREHTLFIRAIINSESFLFGSCWLKYAGSLLGAGDGVIARRNNASPVGPWTRRKPRSIVGSSLSFRKGLAARSEALVSHPAGKQGHQATSLGCQGWGLPALVSFSEASPSRPSYLAATLVVPHGCA